MRPVTSCVRHIPVRLVVGVMIFLSGMFAYMLTFNFSISLLAMVQARPEDGGDDGDGDAQLPDFGPRYAWSPYEQSLLVGAYFYGNVLSAVPSGLLLERFGHAKSAVLWTFAACSALGLLSPLAAGLSFGAMFAVRFAMGVLQGVLYPAYTYLIARWSPTGELGMFTVTIMGANLGTVLTWSLSGVLIESLGWAASFYVTGTIAAVFSAAWLWLVYDAPAVHPRIGATERQYIEAGQRGDGCGRSAATAAASGWPPLGRMALSVPVWALFVVQFGNSWGSFFVLTAAPKFLNEILGFQLASTGVLASLPYILRTVVSLLAGYASQWLEARFPAVSLSVWRKAFSVISHVVPGLLLLALPPFADRPYVCVALMTLSYGLNGAVSVVSISNYHDLAPNYATTLNAIINGLGNSAGFLSPLVVAYFTEEQNTIAEWRSIFIVGAAVYIVPAAVFAIGGSGRVQPWNEPIAQRRPSNSVAAADNACTIKRASAGGCAGARRSQCEAN